MTVFGLFPLTVLVKRRHCGINCQALYRQPIEACAIGKEARHLSRQVLYLFCGDFQLDTFSNCTFRQSTPDRKVDPVNSETGIGASHSRPRSRPQ